MAMDIPNTLSCKALLKKKYTEESNSVPKDTKYLTLYQII